MIILRKHQSVFLTVAKYAIPALMFILLFYLLLLAGFSTTHITEQEHSYFVHDNFWLNLLCSVGFTLFLYFVLVRFTLFQNFVNKVNSDIVYSNLMRRICLSIIFFLSIIFIGFTQKIPIADQRAVADIAIQWHNKDYSCFLPGGYLDAYQNQLGMVIIHYFSGFVFGGKNFLVFQIVNIIGLVFLYKAFADIMDIEGCKRIYGLMIILLGIIFVPPIMYANFVYGNIIGLSLSINCIKQSLLYCTRKRWRYLFFCLIMAFAAISLKNNYLIFIIGIILLVFIQFLKNHSKKLFIMIISLIIVVFFNGAILNKMAQKIAGIEIGNGMSKWAWIAMGLHENEIMYNGWFNGYTNISYIMSKYDKTIQSQASKKYIKSRLKEMSKNKMDAVQFFSGKNGSQWNNPTFQCLWINQVMPSNIQLPPWMFSLLSGTGAARLTIFLNYMQFMILFGAMLFLALGKNRRSPVTCCYCLIFIGGFVFHTFWEAKCQYTLPYFMLLLPMAVAGYHDLCCFMRHRNRRDQKAIPDTACASPRPVQ